MGAGRQDLTATDLCQYNLQMCCTYLPSEGLPDDDALLRIIAEEEVQFARGDSDDEAIRDRDDTKEERVWFGHLDPYCYRLDFCRKSSKRYRRIMKGLMESNSGTLSFAPAFESDDEGDHKQPSFVPELG